MQEIEEEKWLKLWNLFDIKQALFYTLEDRLYDITDVRGYLNDKYLVEAFDEIDQNLETLHDDSHFMYLYRIREEARLLYSDLSLTGPESVHKINPEYTYFKSLFYLKEVSDDIREKLTEKYFLDLYNAIYLLHYNVEIEMNELISRIPLRTKTDNQVISKDDHFKETILEQKEQVVHIYGGTTIVGNRINNISIPYTGDSELAEKDENQVIDEICNQFKTQVEYNGLHRLLYEKDKKTIKHESVSQKLFFSVAQIYCIANDLDVSPETNSGSGSVDFKFSRGNAIKINVELKLTSNNKLIGGYTKQLEAYNLAEGTNKSYYVVIDVKDNPKLEELKEKAKQNKFPVLKIINGKYKETASKL